MPASLFLRHSAKLVLMKMPLLAVVSATILASGAFWGIRHARSSHPAPQAEIVSRDAKPSPVARTTPEKEHPSVFDGVLLFICIIALIAIIASSAISSLQNRAVREQQEWDAVNQSFIAGHPQYNLEGVISGDYPTGGGLSLRVAGEACAVEAKKLSTPPVFQTITRRYGPYGGLTEITKTDQIAYTAFATKANDAFYIRFMDISGGVHVCKVTGDRSSANASLIE